VLGTILKLFRPSYALTALILFGGWQGYTFVKSIPQKLSLQLGIKQVDNKKAAQAVESNQSAETEQLETKQLSSNPAVAAIQKIRPGMRIMSWIIVYVLLCFTTVPVIKRMLACESNLVNAILIIVYSGLGLLLAFVFTAFQFGRLALVMLIAAVIFSACIIIWLAGELEKMRVQDSFGAS
jgi:hypothetical protein